MVASQPGMLTAPGWLTCMLRFYGLKSPLHCMGEAALGRVRHAPWLFMSQNPESGQQVAAYQTRWRHLREDIRL